VPNDNDAIIFVCPRAMIRQGFSFSFVVFKTKIDRNGGFFHKNQSRFSQDIPCTATTDGR
jgi:hypothetical protein